MPIRHLSSPERTAIGVVLVVLLLHAVGAAPALEYQRRLLSGEPWRALTGHLVHINWLHAVINAVALWIVARLFAPDLGARAQASVLVASALAISAALALLYPSIDWYRGLSGVLHGLFFAGATKWLVTQRPRSWGTLWLPAALVIGGWIKVAFEQSGDASTPHADWLGAAVVPQAHLVGALCGTVLGALFAAAQARGEQQRAQQ